MTAQTELEPLTRRQERVYRVIARHYREHRYAASLREIAAALGIRSPNGVVCHVQHLKKKGWVTSSEHQARSTIPTLEALAHEDA
jgi:repressor LexA